MFYTLFTFLVWLLLGAASFGFSFTPTLIAFVIAIIADFYFKPWGNK